MDAFISYAHEDGDFAGRLVDALGAREREVWIDKAGIEPADRWKVSAHEAIERSEAFVFILSPASLLSDPCRDELEHASSLNKRLIAICIDERVTDMAVPSALAELSWIMMRPQDEFERGIAQLIHALETDLELVRAHTRILVRARAWELAERRASPLLRGEELTAAEEWLSRAALGGGVQPTELQREFIRASRRAATRRQRTVVAASLTFGLVAVALSIFALIQRAQAIGNQHLAQSRQLAAAAEQVLPSDPELSALLAMKALSIRYSTQAEAALRDALPADQVRRTFGGDGSHVNGVALTRDGSRIAAGFHDGTVRVWDAASGQLLTTLREPSGRVIDSVAVSPDGRRLLSSSDDGTARLWDLPSGRAVTVFREPSGAIIRDATFNSDGSRVLTASQDSSARVWDVATGRPLAVLREPGLGGPGGAAMYTASFSPDGTRVVTANTDGVARVWSLSTRRPTVSVTEPGQASLYDAELSPDGHRLLTASFDGTARVWDASSGRQSELLAEPGGATLESAAFSPDGARIVTASLDGTARVWDAQTGVQITALLGHQAPILQVGFSRDGKSVVTAGYDGTVKLWYAWPREMVARMVEPARAGLDSGVFSPDGRRIATGSQDGTTRVWSAASGQIERVLPQLARKIVESVRFSPDGSRLVSVDGNGNGVLWNVGDGRPLALFAGRGGGDTDVAFDRDGHLIATSSDSGAIRVFAVASHPKLLLPQVMGVTEPAGAIVTSVAFGSEANRLLTASADATARVWNVPGGQAVAAIRSPGGGFKQAQFAAQDRSVLTAGYDGTARLWDLASGRQLAAFAVPRGPFLASAELSPDQQRVLAAASDGSTRIWSVNSGAQLALFTEPGGKTLTGAAFSSDGTRLLTTSADGTAIVWSTETAGPLRALQRLARQRITRNLTARERAEYLAGI